MVAPTNKKALLLGEAFGKIVPNKRDAEDVVPYNQNIEYRINR